MEIPNACIVVCLLALAAALQPPADRYQPEDGPQRREATDHPADGHRSPKATPNEPHKPGNFLGKLQKAAEADAEDSRQRRSIVSSAYFNQWVSVSGPPLSSYSLWQPQYYQISRPYFIPVWGAPGRVPFFFPPQPLYSNPGYPVHNPPTQYLPPPPNNAYLPPSPGGGEDKNETYIGTKFDDPPIWGVVTSRPTTTTVRPTRAPSNQRTSTHPSPIRPQGQATTTTARPSSAGKGSPSSDQPNIIEQPPFVSTPTQAPPVQGLQPVGPSKCTWAIVSCCAVGSAAISYSCFEQLGCVGPFWDNSPCESDYARAAIASVLNYYNN